MKYRISELAKLTGVSVRTLHYYDDIGLLKPAETDSGNGYRLYDENSLERLKKILYYRELEFPLKAIPEILGSVNISGQLLERRRQIYSFISSPQYIAHRNILLSSLFRNIFHLHICLCRSQRTWLFFLQTRRRNMDNHMYIYKEAYLNHQAPYTPLAL